MRCKDAQKMMDAWVDGELLPDKKTNFEYHLANCRACSSEAQRLSRLAGFLDTHPPVLPSAELEEKTLALFIKEIPPKGAQHWWSGLGWQMPTTMAAGAVIGLGIGGNLGATWASTQIFAQYSTSGFLFSAGDLLLSWV